MIQLNLDDIICFDLSYSDLKWGYDNSLLDPGQIINYVANNIGHLLEQKSCVADLELELAGLLKKESYEFETLLNQLSFNEKLEPNLNKWIYILLYWVVAHKDQVNDIEAEIALLYESLDYPKSIAHLVYYMPCGQSEDAGKSILFKLSKFLQKNKPLYFKC